MLGSKRLSLIGLDIQAEELNLLHMKKMQQGWKIENFATAKLPAQAMMDGKIIESDCVTSCLKKLVKETGTRGLAAAIALPTSQVISRQISLPDYHDEQMVEAEIHSHLNQYLPGITEEISFDYHLENAQQALLMAAKQDIVSSYVDVVNGSGLLLKIVDVDWCALARVIHFLIGLENKTVGVIDIAENNVRFDIFQNAKRVFTQPIVIDLQCQDVQYTLLKAIFQPVYAAQMSTLVLIGRAMPSQIIHDVLLQQSNLQIVTLDLKSNVKFSKTIIPEHCVKALQRSPISLGLALRDRPLW